MPKFRFETTTSGQTTISEEELDSVNLASPKAVEKAHAAVEAGSDKTDTAIKVYDDAGYLIATVDFSKEALSELEPSDDQLTGDEPGVMRSG